MRAREEVPDFGLLTMFEQAMRLSNGTPNGEVDNQIMRLLQAGMASRREARTTSDEIYGVAGGETDFTDVNRARGRILDIPPLIDYANRENGGDYTPGSEDDEEDDDSVTGGGDDEDDVIVGDEASGEGDTEGGHQPSTENNVQSLHSMVHAPGGWESLLGLEHERAYGSPTDHDYSVDPGSVAAEAYENEMREGRPGPSAGSAAAADQDTADAEAADADAAADQADAAGMGGGSGGQETDWHTGGPVIDPDPSDGPELSATLLDKEFVLTEDDVKNFGGLKAVQRAVAEARAKARSPGQPSEGMPRDLRKQAGPPGGPPRRPERRGVPDSRILQPPRRGAGYV